MIPLSNSRPKSDEFSTEINHSFRASKTIWVSAAPSVVGWYELSLTDNPIDNHGRNRSV